MSDQKVTFTVFLKDYLSGGMDKISRSGGVTFSKLHAGFKNIVDDSKKVSYSIREIDNELSKLHKRQVKLHVDDSDLKRVNKQIKTLEAQKSHIQNLGSKSASSGMGLLSKAGLYGAAITAAYKGVQFVGSTVNSFDQGAKADAQLSAGLKSTGGISGKTVGSMSAQADMLQGMTMFDDESTKAAQAMMLTFTKVRGEVFDKSIPIIQDMATRMGGGPESLSATAIQVGKALNDPIGGVTALRRVGVQLTDQQELSIKKFMALGEVEKAQAIILKELNTEFGGSAQAAAKAGTGGLTILKNKFDNLKESVGKSITPIALAFGDLATESLKLVQASPAEDLYQQKQMFIQLGAAVSSESISDERRKDLLKQMKELQPDFLKGLDLEKTSYSDIKNAIADSLSLYDQRINYLTAEQKAMSEINKVQEYSDQLTKLRQSAAESKKGSFEQQTDSYLVGAKSLNFLQSINNHSGGILNAMAWTSNIVYGKSFNEKLQEYNITYQKTGEKLLEKQKNVAEYTNLILAASKTGDITALNAFEKRLGKMGITMKMMAKFKEQYKGLAGGEPGAGDGTGDGPKGPGAFGIDAKALSDISNGGVAIKQITINLDNLVETVNNNFDAGQSPADSQTFMDKLTAALQLVLNDVNYA